MSQAPCYVYNVVEERGEHRQTLLMYCTTLGSMMISHVDHDRVYNRHVVGIIMMSFDVCLERSSLNVGWRKVKDTPISATYVLPSDVSSQA